MRFQNVMKRWVRLDWRIVKEAARDLLFLFTIAWLIFMMLGAAFIMAYGVSELLTLLGLTIG